MHLFSVLALLVIGCVILDKGVNLSKSLFPHRIVVRGESVTYKAFST